MPDKKPSHRRPRLPRLGLTWRKDAAGYRLSRDRKRIVRRGGRLVPYQVADAKPAPHRAFAALQGQIWQANEPMPPAVKGSPFKDRVFEDMADAVLAFVREFGFVGGDEWGVAGERGEFERVDYLWDRCTYLAAFLEFAPTTPVQVALTIGERAEPRTLLDWMWLAASNDIAGGADRSGPPCLYCRAPMTRGAGGYRKHARYCSSKCATYFHRLPEAEKRQRLVKAGWIKTTRAKR